MEKPIKLLELTFNPIKLKQIIGMVEAMPNDMDLGKAVRKLVAEYNEQEKKPPFTSDYTQ